MSVITDCPYICAPNIMDTPDYQTKMVTLDMADQTVIKAGTPISAEGKVANDETAIGILLNDCYACLNPRLGIVVISGRIKQDVAAEHSGITISDEAKSAMINLTFTGDGARGGGGGAQPDWNQDDDTAPDYVKNRPGGYESYEEFSGTINFLAAGDTSEYSHFELPLTADAYDATVKIGDKTYYNVPICKEGYNDEYYTIGDPRFAEYPFLINAGVNRGSGFYSYHNWATEPGEKEVYIRVRNVVKMLSRFVSPSGSTNRLGPYYHEGITVGDWNSCIDGSIVCGLCSEAGTYACAIGSFLNAADNQFVIGQCNMKDSSRKYAFIVGNGETTWHEGTGVSIVKTRSNAHTLDWGGNAWFAGTMEGTALILKSATEGSTKKFKITVDDSGTLSATEVTE